MERVTVFCLFQCVVLLLLLLLLLLLWFDFKGFFFLF